MTTRRDVEFQSEGTTCRGWLYVAKAGERRPTVVLAGGWCYVREIVMPTYAEAFVEAGFNALVFDYRNLGVSDGDDRQHLDPWAQVRDYQNAVSFLERHDEVDPNRIGAWGISYSGGHVLILAAIDPRVKTIVTQIPVVDGYENMRRVHGTMEYRALWKLILEDRKLRYEQGERLYLPHAVADPNKEVSAWPFPETVNDVHGDQGVARASLPEPEHGRVGRPADAVRHRAVRETRLQYPDNDDRRRRRRPDRCGTSRSTPSTRSRRPGRSSMSSRTRRT